MKYTDADPTLNRILNNSRISEPIHRVNEFHQQKPALLLLFGYAIFLFVLSWVTKDKSVSDSSRMSLLIGSGIIWYPLVQAIRSVKSSDVQTLHDNNLKILEYFQTRDDCKYLSYVLEQRSKEKGNLDAKWQAILSTFFVICGLSGFIRTFYGGHLPRISTVELILATLVIAFLIHTSSFGEYLNHATWELLAEDANLALIEKNSKQDHPCR